MTGVTPKIAAKKEAAKLTPKIDRDVEISIGKEIVIKDPRIAVIRTSDSNTFKQCRRKWNWTSHLRMNLGSIQVGNPLWLGSGFHYALEDFHGRNQYGSGSMALQAFARAYKDKYPKKVPDDWKELLRLGCEMMDYYPIWLKGRDPLTTYTVNDAYQNEVGIKIGIPWALLEAKCDKERFKRIRDKYDSVVYSVTLDRVIIDEHDALWVQEYKTAKVIQSTHLLNDAQVTRYLWAANIIYDKPVSGVIYQQHRKATPDEPKKLVAGGFSIAANQRVSHRSYRNALIKEYGEVKKAPGINVKFLNDLAKLENEDFDNFIRRDRVQRNIHARQAVAQQILYEAIDMLDPELPLYPAPNRMGCTMMCGMIGPCVSMDDGSDWEQDLKDETETRPLEYDLWRSELPDPATFKGVSTAA